ncbi:isochorismatase [Viridibacillus sp. YIM B01967]|uniref:isochorismatase n=1 Tax=Viridibacillus soli TaxID=2798301 RepID=A0ABS1HBE1_9BACL|nr:isochorismatase [Viridibacillus soli]MBK3496762.1 isochorismatase [Viridibacillus soli]
MAIPAITPYAMPVESELPKNKVSWKVDPSRSVLLVHDMQQYFLDYYTVTESPITELISHIQSIKIRCVDLGIPVVYTAQPGNQNPEDRALLTDFWGPGLDDDINQTKVVEEIAPSEDDIVLTKWRYSAFKRTNLLEMMREQGRDQLIICGVYAHIGCLLTASEAFMQDIEPFLVTDAVADFSLEEHKMAIKYAAERCAVTTSTSRLLEQLNSGEQASAGVVQENDDPGLTLDGLRIQIADLLGESPSDIGDNENLVDIGIDSIRMMSLVEILRGKGAEINFMQLAEKPTIAAWWELLSSQKVLA